MWSQKPLININCGRQKNEDVKNPHHLLVILLNWTMEVLLLLVEIAMVIQMVMIGGVYRIFKDEILDQIYVLRNVGGNHEKSDIAGKRNFDNEAHVRAQYDNFGNVHSEFTYVINFH